ncbi:hypothetical protein MVEN_02526200 [Mycena venus]|uniref:Uncharacterized protein n=1 Tax=Mycena venus TaxID=2733690 RepID=A0A8H7CAA9_9AGAR|nr:hypothetical protein MVEN_02526200 [Mycena venus]
MMSAASLSLSPFCSSSSFICTSTETVVWRLELYRPMSFIGNASHFSLGEGVYNMYNVHGNFVSNFHVILSPKGSLDGSDLLLLKQRAEKRRSLEDDGMMIIPSKYLKLICEIGSGAGYCLHVAQNKGRAVLVKVFNRVQTLIRYADSSLKIVANIQNRFKAS